MPIKSSFSEACIGKGKTSLGVTGKVLGVCGGILCEDSSLGFSYQIKTFFFGGYYYLLILKLVGSVNKIRLYSSTDGTNWSFQNDIVDIGAASSAADFSIWFDGASVYLVYLDDAGVINNLIIMKGTPLAGNIAWGAGHTIENTLQKYRPTVCKAPNGTLYVSFEVLVLGRWHSYVTKSTDDGVTWDAVTDVAGGGFVNSGRPLILAFSDSTAYLIYYKETSWPVAENKFVGRTWNGTQGGGLGVEEDIKVYTSSLDVDYWCGRVDTSDIIHFSWKSSVDTVMIHRERSGGVWQPENTVSSTAGSSPIIIINTTNLILYVFQGMTIIKYTYNGATNLWDTGTTVKTDEFFDSAESQMAISNDRVEENKAVYAYMVNCTPGSADYHTRTYATTV